MSPATSTRWCPTPEQLMILEELYKHGVRTPNATQIQRITSHLSMYGKIEGKNVFYWFQNHKARDRQKLRKKFMKQLQQHQQQIQRAYDLHHHQQQQQLIMQHDHASRHGLFNLFDPPSFPHAPAPSTSQGFHQIPFHQFLSPCPLPLQVPNEEAAKAQMVSQSWKLAIPRRAIDDQSLTTKTNIEEVGSPPSSCCTDTSPRGPIKTLDLFPITSTNLKDECSQSAT